MSNVSVDSSSWSFDSKGFSNTAKIDPFSAVYAVMKKEDELVASLPGGEVTSYQEFNWK